MKWTNASLRRHLGEHGFIVGDETVQSGSVFYTPFTRGNDELTLVEFTDDAEPQVFQDGQPVDVMNIGYRNEQIQHDKLKGD